MSVEHVNAKRYEELIHADKPVLLDFYADWCGPCRMLTPIMEEIAAEHPELAVGKVNVDEEMGLAKLFGITSIPYVALVKNGTLVASSLGYRQKQDLLETLGL